MASHQRIITRRAEPRDAWEVVEVSRQAHDQGYEGSCHREEEFLAKLEHAFRSLWVAEEEGRVVGFAFSAFQWGKLHVEDLIVHPQSRQRGIGRQLMQRLIELGKEHKVSEVYLEVFMDNEPALRLYRSLGFVKRIALTFLSRPFYGLYLPLEGKE